MSWKSQSVVVTFSVVVSLLAGSMTASAESTETVEIEGTFRILTGNVTPVFIPQELVRLPFSLILPPPAPPGGFEETFRFDSFDVDVATGGTLRWTNTTVAPHTITIVRRSDQPQDLNAAFACFAPTAACGSTIAKHFPPGGGVVPDVGSLGLGDTHLVGPVGGPFRTSFETKVNLPAGTVLFYMCGFHPQMQGTIIVEGK